MQARSGVSPFATSHEVSFRDGSMVAWFRVWGLGFGFWDLGFGVWGSEIGVGKLG